MVCSGTYGELTASGVDLKSFLKRTTECDAVSETSFNTTSQLVRARRFSRLISVESMTENVTEPAQTTGTEIEVYNSIIIHTSTYQLVSIARHLVTVLMMSIYIK